MSIVCKWQEREPGDENVRTVLLLADTTPATMPISGVGVSGLDDTAHIAGGSVLIDLQKSEKHIMGNDMTTWHKWG